MTSTDLPDQGLVFWPVGSGDSTTIVVDNDHVVQVDLRDMEMADDDDPVVAAVVDRLVEVLPKRDGEPYLSAFVLTHADQDHCLGFADLLSRVKIGELWATPRLWREYTESNDDSIVLCDDAKAFHEEVLRRVEVTKKAVSAGSEPASGDRVRIVGYDTDEGDFSYHDLPETYLSKPGQAVSLLDGEDLAGTFEAFIHAPFKDDCAEARNDTSLALQVTLTDDSGQTGHVLLLGDLAYETIMKIFTYSEDNERPERLAWDVLLAPHHCSKRVMYVTENGTEVLKQDILDLLEKHASPDAEAVIVASSHAFPSTNKSGDNPPHLIARDRYEEIVTELVCTGEHPSADAPRPVVFGLGDNGFYLLEVPTTEAAAKSLSLSAGQASLGVLALLGASWIARKQSARWTASPRGLDEVRRTVETARGERATPQQAVAFGRR